MKLALIGYGYWGPNIARNLNLSDKVEFYGVSELNAIRLEKAKSVYGEKLIYTDDYHVFLKNEMLEGVVIATPTAVSYQIVMDFLSAGKHVFVEKPIAINAENARNIENKAKEMGLTVHCDHIMLYHPIVRYIKNMIDTGELGELLYIDVSRVNLGPLHKDVNALLDLAVHDIAVIDYLSGGQTVEEMSAMGHTCFGKQETLTYLTIKYEKFIAHIKSSWISPVKERKMLVAGTKKMVIFDDLEMDKLVIYDRGFDLQMSEEYGEYEYHIRLGDINLPHIQQEDALRNSIEHFVECAEKKEASLSGTESSIRVMEILDEALKKLKEE